MEIKTIVHTHPDEFDRLVNAAMVEGCRLVKRERVDVANCKEVYFLYAELTKPDPKPAQELEITWQQAVKVLHDICRANSEGVAYCPEDCPIKSWCDQAIPPEGKRPEMWELPDD